MVSYSSLSSQVVYVYQANAGYAAAENPVMASRFLTAVRVVESRARTDGGWYASRLWDLVELASQREQAESFLTRFSHRQAA